MAASQPLGEDEMSPVRFLIAGVQKCGTSALDAYLRGHPELEMARIKETHFFDNEVDVDWRTPDSAALHSLYDGNGSAMRGEATPITFYWTPAHYRVLRYNPDMKFILLFRDPVERAWSHWKMAAAAGRDTCSFSAAIRSGRVRVLDDGGPAGLSRWLSYVERGYYARQLHELTRLFPLENMLFLKQDELSRTPDLALARVAEFLKVAPFEPTPPIKVHTSAWLEGEMMNESDRSYLTELYADDSASFGALTGIRF